MIIILPTGTGFIVGASPLNLLGSPAKRKPITGVGPFKGLTAAAFAHQGETKADLFDGRKKVQK